VRYRITVVTFMRLPVYYGCPVTLVAVVVVYIYVVIWCRLRSRLPVDLRSHGYVTLRLRLVTFRLLRCFTFTVAHALRYVAFGCCFAFTLRFTVVLAGYYYVTLRWLVDFAVVTVTRWLRTFTVVRSPRCYTLRWIYGYLRFHTRFVTFTLFTLRLLYVYVLPVTVTRWLRFWICYLRWLLFPLLVTFVPFYVTFGCYVVARLRVVGFAHTFPYRLITFTFAVGLFYVVAPRFDLVAPHRPRCTLRVVTLLLVATLLFAPHLRCSVTLRLLDLRYVDGWFTLRFILPTRVVPRYGYVYVCVCYVALLLFVYVGLLRVAVVVAVTLPHVRCC